jgi:hypothetical protein
MPSIIRPVSAHSDTTRSKVQHPCTTSQWTQEEASLASSLIMSSRRLRLSISIASNEAAVILRRQDLTFLYGKMRSILSAFHKAQQPYLPPSRPARPIPKQHALLAGLHPRSVVTLLSPPSHSSTFTPPKCAIMPHSIEVVDSTQITNLLGCYLNLYRFNYSHFIITHLQLVVFYTR